MPIRYKSGYKYQLVEDADIQTCIKPMLPIETEFIRLDSNGLLTIKNGYAWDGPSGPTVDTKTFMRGSLVHDAFYQLMREGKLAKEWKNKVDEELGRICVEDGMWSIRAKWVVYGVKKFGYDSMVSNKDILQAP